MLMEVAITSLLADFKYDIIIDSSIYEAFCRKV